MSQARSRKQFPAVVAIASVAALSLGASRATADSAAEAKALLAAVTAGGTAKKALESAASLATLTPPPVEFFAAFLQRTRTSTDDERREVLRAIDAAVPNEKGRFETPRRQTEAEKKATDDMDWLKALGAAKPPGAAVGDVVADIAVIRSLAASQAPRAGELVLDFAFSEVGIIYRDECGRYLRKMSPWSLPALIRASQDRSDSSRRRYALYQLERLDREDPHKALRYTEGELKVAVMRAYAESGYRTAVYAMMNLLNDGSPPIRNAARAALTQIISGKNVRPAPKKKMVLPGGKLGDKPVPMWRDQRELADIELRRTLTKLTGTAPAKSATLQAMTDQLFLIYDTQREEALSRLIDSAVAQMSTNPAEAAKLARQVEAQYPTHPRRGELSDVFFHYAETLETDGKWLEAAAAYASAYAAAPLCSKAKQARAQEKYSRGKLLQSEGVDATAEFKAAREAGASGVTTGSAGWMLYTGIGGAVFGLALVVLGIRRRR